jgi:hypothetical protein
MARFAGEPVEDVVDQPKAPRFKGQSLDQPITSEVPTTRQEGTRPSLIEGAKEVAKQGGIGGVAGYFAPEILTGMGAAAAAFPPTAPAAPFLFGSGQALRGQRAASTAMGIASSLMGETAGQVVERTGGTPTQAELARFAAGTFGPEIPRQFGSATGTLVGRALGALGVPGASKVTTIGQLLEREGVRPGSLSAEQREFIQKKLDQVRGGASSLVAQQEIADMLRAGAGGIYRQAEREAADLEAQAGNILQEATRAAGRIDQNLQQRINNLQSQFEAASEKIRSSAQQQAQQVLSQAQTRANTIMTEAMQQSPQVQQLAKVDADQIIAQGRKQADDILAKSQDRMNRMRDVRDRLRSSGQERVQQAAVRVGEPQRVSQLGRDIRQSFVDVLTRLKDTRSANADVNKQAAFGEAFQKEASGATVNQTKAAANAVQELNVMLKNPVSKLAGVPEGTIRNQIKNVRDLLLGTRRSEVNGQSIEVSLRPSFEQLEMVRRNLRDRAAGLPAEGYDAIGQQEAGRLAELVEKVQVEFSPNFAKFLNQYRIDSAPINKFANDLGKAITGRSDADFNEYAVDPARLASRVFDSEATVAQLINTAGPERAEQIARSFVAERLRNATAKDVQSFVQDSKTQDWLFQFPALQQQLTQAAQRLSTAERTAKRRVSLADVLGTEIRTLPISAGRAMTRAEEDAARAAQARVRAGEREAAQLTRGAETAAARDIGRGEAAFGEITGGAERQIGASAKAVERQTKALESEAERQAKQVTAAAETEATALTKEAKAIRDKANETVALLTKADQTGTSRVRDLILSENERELTETAKIILANPQGKKLFEDAIGQVVADLAVKSPKNAIEKWRYASDALGKVGLVDANTVQRITSDLQDLMVSPISGKERVTLARSLFRNFLIGYAVPGVERGVSSLVEGEDATR